MAAWLMWCGVGVGVGGKVVVVVVLCVLCVCVCARRPDKMGAGDAVLSLRL